MSATITHGRHCSCSACARQDWSEPGLACCGMHGPECPPVYAPMIRCPDCWNGKPIPCATGCREWDECCDKNLDGPCERCEGSGWLRVEQHR